VFHPDKAIAELCASAGAAISRCPRPISKVLRSFPGHLWFVTLEKGALSFAEGGGIVDQELIDTLETRLMDKDPLFSAYYTAGFYPLFTIGSGGKHYSVPRGSARRSREAFIKGSADLPMAMSNPSAPEDSRARKKMR